MAGPRYPRREGPLPPPLPPETRTVGQLVAESISLYRLVRSGLCARRRAPATASGAARRTRGRDPRLAAGAVAQHAIQRLVENPLALRLLEGDPAEGDSVRVEVRGEELVLERAGVLESAAA